MVFLEADVTCMYMLCWRKKPNLAIISYSYCEHSIRSMVKTIQSKTSAPKKYDIHFYLSEIIYPNLIICHINAYTSSCNTVSMNLLLQLHNYASTIRESSNKTFAMAL